MPLYAEGIGGRGPIFEAYLVMAVNHLQSGLAMENTVAEALASRGWLLVKQRWRTPFAEVDLFVRKDGEDALVEVKTVSKGEFPREFRLSWRQRDRLERARDYVEMTTGRLTRLMLAWVTIEGQISLFNLPDGDIEWVHDPKSIPPPPCVRDRVAGAGPDGKPGR